MGESSKRMTNRDNPPGTSEIKEGIGSEAYG